MQWLSQPIHMHAPIFFFFFCGHAKFLKYICLQSISGLPTHLFRYILQFNMESQRLVWYIIQKFFPEDQLCQCFTEAWKWTSKLFIQTAHCLVLADKLLTSSPEVNRAFCQ